MTSLFYWVLWLGFGAWGGMALWVQLPQQRLWVVLGAGLVLALLAGLKLSGEGRPFWALGLVILLLLGWFFCLSPRQDRDWAPDVAHIVKGEVAGDRVRLEHVRDFRWDGEYSATQERWTTREVDLRKLAGVDMITSVWGSPKIAHLLVSFRFTDAPPVSFSVEIRRETTEVYSAIGGFFRQFEVALIAANEEDIVLWRAGPRAEDVRIYPLRLTRAQMRALFLAYIDYGNALNAAPAWYNTLTANCTTVVWQLTKVLGVPRPWHRGLLLSGLLPEYLDSLNGLAGEGDLDEKRARAAISEKAQSLPDGADFSDWVRQ